mmetsp:Transcript_37263/g.117163  ORF Transcript_37263/g.117163 Transcript_37263/m.117163 type:complete len:219 (-) Transcript_37263:222-878(-)
MQRHTAEYVSLECWLGDVNMCSASSLQSKQLVSASHRTLGLHHLGVRPLLRALRRRLRRLPPLFVLERRRLAPVRLCRLARRGASPERLGGRLARCARVAERELKGADRVQPLLAQPHRLATKARRRAADCRVLCRQQVVDRRELRRAGVERATALLVAAKGLVAAPLGQVGQQERQIATRRPPLALCVLGVEGRRRDDRVAQPSQRQLCGGHRRVDW